MTAHEGGNGSAPGAGSEGAPLPSALSPHTAPARAGGFICQDGGGVDGDTRATHTLKGSITRAEMGRGSSPAESPGTAGSTPARRPDFTTDDGTCYHDRDEEREAAAVYCITRGLVVCGAVALLILALDLLDII